MKGDITMKHWKLLVSGLAVALCLSMAACELPGMAQSGGIHKATKTGDAEKVKSLLAENPNLINTKDKLRGFTPLHTAAIAGQYETAEILLKAGADPNATDNKGKTPYFHANDQGNNDVAGLTEEYGGE